MTANHSFTQQAYSQAVGISPTNYPILSDRDPGVSDIYYKIGQFWINNKGIRLWYLNSQSNVSGVLQSSWVEVSNSLANVDQLQGDDGIPVSPTAGIIQTLGNTVANSTYAKPLYVASGGGNIEQFNIQISTALSAGDSTKVGLSNFDSTSFDVSAAGFVTLVGGGFTWTDISGTFTAAKNNGYFITGTATANLPASPSQGDTIKFLVDHASQVLTIDAPGTQLIRFGTIVTSAGGTAVSTQQGDSCELVYRAANTCWEAINFVGTWILT